MRVSASLLLILLALEVGCGGDAVETHADARPSGDSDGGASPDRFPLHMPADAATSSEQAESATLETSSAFDAGSELVSQPDCGCYNGDGLYCGQAVVDYATRNGCRASFADDHRGSLLRCTGGAYVVESACKVGCVIAPSGQPDFCKADGSREYLLPWSCGVSLTCTQGFHGDICGSNGGDHTGVQEYAWDFGLPRHTALRASRGGKVTVAANVTTPGKACYDGCTQPFNTSAFWNCCNGCLNISNHVNIDHGDGTVASYLHLDVATVEVGQLVQQGDIIGYSGTSGCSSGPHLHFQVMGNCPTGYCQSVAIRFADGGAPACGERVTSQNACP
jgi:murein DD-endopeptidase MepM/ murein hydrolase activator NlpD